MSCLSALVTIAVELAAGASVAAANTTAGSRSLETADWIARSFLFGCSCWLGGTGCPPLELSGSGSILDAAAYHHNATETCHSWMGGGRSLETVMAAIMMLLS